jgi:hypothetical protein
MLQTQVTTARDELVAQCLPFLAEVKDMTPGTDVEQWLNRKYGPGSNLYDNLPRLLKAGVEERWAANIEIDGPRYMRSGIHDPTAETFYFSITAVYMQSREKYRGQYRLHPYGELNMVVPIDSDALLAGPNGGVVEDGRH